MNFLNIKIGRRIRVTMFLLLTLFFISLGTVIYQTQKSDIITSTKGQMHVFLDDLRVILSNHVNERQKQVNVSMNLADNFLKSYGKITHSGSKISISVKNQNTQQLHDISIDNWKVGDVELYQNTTIVDSIKSMAVETATIFQKFDQGYVRIASNVMT